MAKVEVVENGFAGDESDEHKEEGGVGEFEYFSPEDEGVSRDFVCGQLHGFVIEHLLGAEAAVDHDDPDVGLDV